MKNTLLNVPFDAKKEIKQLNEEISSLEDMLRDGKLLASGEYSRFELRQEIEQLRKERNQLLYSL